MAKRGLGFSALCGLKQDSFGKRDIEVKRSNVFDVAFRLTSCRFFGRDFVDRFLIDRSKQGGLFILLLAEAGLEFSFTFRVTRHALCFGGFRVELRRCGGRRGGHDCRL